VQAAVLTIRSSGGASASSVGRGEDEGHTGVGRFFYSDVETVQSEVLMKLWRYNQSICIIYRSKSINYWDTVLHLVA